MKSLKLLSAPIAAVVMGLAASNASAEQFDFYKLGRGVLDFLPTNGVSCTGGDRCSSNFPALTVADPGLTFAVGSLTATARGTYNGGIAAVVQDHEASWDATRGDGAGLGVYHVNNDTSDDNVTLGEVLTVTFNQQVRLTGIGLAYEGHLPSGWFPGATFLFNGNSTLLQGTIGSLNMVGTTFTFAFNPATGGYSQQPYGDQFYLSSMTVTAVPEPEIYAMLAAGLGLMGWVGRRRRRGTP